LFEVLHQEQEAELSRASVSRQEEAALRQQHGRLLRGQEEDAVLPAVRQQQPLQQQLLLQVLHHGKV
jgi:hypothetical protein